MSDMKYPTVHVLAKADINDMDLQYRLDMLATTLWCLVWTADFGTKTSLHLDADDSDDRVCLCFDVEVSLPQNDGVHVEVSHVFMGRHYATYAVDRDYVYRTEQVKSGLERFIERAYDEEFRMFSQAQPRDGRKLSGTGDGRRLSSIEARLDAIETRLGICTRFQEGQGEDR